MREIAFYGVGGQGVVTAAQVLVLAAGVYEEQYAQSIPAFTAERRGAPVHAYLRLSDKPILVHSHVYEPDCVVSFAWGATPWSELASGGQRQLMCAANLPSERAEELLKSGLAGCYLDADKLTTEILGRGFPPNAAMLGVFAAATGWVTLQAIAEAVTNFWPGEQGKRNARVVEAAYQGSIRV